MVTDSFLGFFAHGMNSLNIFEGKPIKLNLFYFFGLMEVFNLKNRCLQFKFLIVPCLLVLFEIGFLDVRDELDLFQVSVEFFYVLHCLFII